jgi:hypothetical protein
MLCKLTIFINLTIYPWNIHDFKTYLSIKDKCSEKYKDTQCLSKFTKYKEKDYHAICK